jgi:hypothetical protein
MLHTIYITQKITGKMYLDLIRTNGIKKIIDTSLKQEFILNSLKHEGLTTIKISRTEINYKSKRTGKTVCIINYLVGIQLNPKRLIEKENHLELTNMEDLKQIEERFYVLIKKIHPDLKQFMNWTLKRIDYCTYIRTPYVKDYIKLFQRGNKPANFKNGVYDENKGNRFKQMEGSMYYRSKSGNIKINFYDKEYQLIDERERNENITDKDIENAKNYLRIEIQLDKVKTDGIKFKHKFETKELKYFLSLDLSRQYLTQYYLKTVGRGDYYKLDTAIKIINKSDHTNKKKVNLINLLRLVNACRSVWRAKESFINGYEIEDTGIKLKGTSETFRNYTKDINLMGINLVTIPRAWQIDKFENIYNQIEENLTNSEDDNVSLLEDNINFELE